MTGTSGSAATTTATNITNSLDHTKLLLTDMQKLVESSGKDSLDGEDLSDDFKSYFKLTDLPIRTNRKSVEAGKQAVNVEEESIWTVEFEHSREESEYSSWSKHPAVEEPKSRATSSPEKTYQYQICMFIQMQLCEPFTLADWIRDRRKLQAPPKTVADRIDAVAAIFNQLVLGLAHVHEKGIIHRDLKPANVFVTRFGKECQFKIGDFGLSKLIPRSPIKSDQGATTTRTREMAPQQLAYGPDTAKMEDESEGAPPKSSTAWRDPLTAGVGTASYAAAEQVASRDYGTEADIFSLGLILLETLCGFSTEHERMLTFHDCRHRRTLPDALESFTVVKQTILACTDPDPKKRPRAADLVGIDLRQDVDMRTEQPSVETAAGVDGFRQQIKHRDDTIARLKAELEAKDDIINKLHEELGSLKQNGHPSTRGKIALVIPRARDDSPDFESESCSSTSSDNEL
jgi:serine/threonine protein kinase